MTPFIQSLSKAPIFASGLVIGVVCADGASRPRFSLIFGELMIGPWLGCASDLSLKQLNDARFFPREEAFAVPPLPLSLLLVREVDVGNNDLNLEPALLVATRFPSQMASGRYVGRQAQMIANAGSMTTKRKGMAIVAGKSSDARDGIVRTRPIPAAIETMPRHIQMTSNIRCLIGSCSFQI